MRRSGFTMVELLVVVAIIALLISLLMPQLSSSRRLSEQTVCAANQRGIGQGMMIYAQDNNRRYPAHHFETRSEPEALAPHGIRWIGTMGSTEHVLISEETSRETSPHAGHPSRSLFLLVTSGVSTPGQFVCPSTDDIIDELYNYDGDCEPSKRPECRARPGRDRFDFRGFDALSYAYQMPFGPLARINKHTEAQTPIFADRSPYSNERPALHGTTTDERIMRCERDVPRNVWRAWKPEQWQPYNTPNHAGKGQNVLFMDGHVDFAKTPMVGLIEDNIYTAQFLKDDDPGNVGGLQNAPTRKDDTYLVP